MVEIEDSLAREDYQKAIALMHKGASEASRAFTLSRDVKMSSHAQSLVSQYLLAKEGGLVYDIPWPWRPLQEATGGIEPGTFNVIYGRPKSTKTWRLLQIAATAREANKRVLLVSCEMQEKIMLRRIAAIDCELDYTHLKKGLLSKEEEDLYLAYLEQQEKMQFESEIIVTMLSDDTSSRTVSALRAKIEQHEPDLILIDSAYKMVDEQTGRRDSKPETIRNLTNDLQHLAGTSRLPMVITSQANRAGEKARQGTTVDAAFSDSFGMDCDLMLRVTNDAEIERTVFFIQAAREVEIEGFSTKNRCGNDMGPYVRSDGVEDWSIPKKYLEGEGGGNKGGGTNQPKNESGTPNMSGHERFS